MNLGKAIVSAGALALASACPAFAAPLDPWADSVWSYDPGALQESPIGSGAYFTEPAEALGPVSILASRMTPSTEVVQLGQGGSITLRFDEPIENNLPAPGTSNPLGVDLVVFGNAFEAGFAGSGVFYREPGFVEVAELNAEGGPGTWYLLLPGRVPAELEGGRDSGPGPLFAGYADVSPVDGAGDPLLPPEDPDSAGGDGLFLERAVLQSSPGVPLLDGQGRAQFARLAAVHFVRITDAVGDDGGPTGFFTTDVDAVADLPGTVPEPGLAALCAAAAALIPRRGPRRRC